MTDWHQGIIEPDEVRTLDGLFVERTRRTPEAPAYRSFNRDDGEWKSMNWAEAGRETARWQAALARVDLQDGDRVAIALRNCPQWVFFEQAALGLGLVVVPLYTDDRPDNSAYVLEDSGASVLLVQDERYWKRLAPYLQSATFLKQVLLLNGPAEEGDPRVQAVDDWLDDTAGDLSLRQGDPHALASIVYTSGTTGRPKGVMLSHHNMMSVARASLTLADCYQEDVFLSFLPLSHTLERTGGYYLPMMAGSEVAYARSIAQLADDLQAVRPTMLVAVPRIFERVYARIQQQMEKQSAIRSRLFYLAVDVGWHRFEHQQGRAGWGPDLLLWPVLKALVASKISAKLGGRLRLAVSGGAPLTGPIARLFIGLGIPILQGYGLTETSPVISVNPPDDNDPDSVGVPLPGVEIRIGDDQELLVKTPGAMLGYWHRPEATAEVIDREGWLHTGDQARFENHHVYITGRIKDILVLSNGEKVPPADMESGIALDGMFEQVMVVGEGRAFLSAIVVLNQEKWQELAHELGLDPGDPASLEEKRVHTRLQARISDALKDFPGYAKVRRLVVSLEPWSVEQGLLTPTLKVKRQRVLERFSEELEAIYGDGRTRQAG